MAQVVFNHVVGKPPFFDGTSSFDYWRRKMKMYPGSINDRAWDITEHDFVILDATNLTDNERANKQHNTIALNNIYNGIVDGSYHLSQIVNFVQENDHQ
jgi:hypothetical protein